MFLFSGVQGGMLLFGGRYGEKTVKKNVPNLN